MTKLNDEQLLRYSRQIMLPAIDIAGQEKLLAAQVAIIGAGGLGCPAAMYLAAAGVGRLTLIDDDVVELSNLQRQIAHTTADIGTAKVASVKNTVQALNAGCDLTVHQTRLDENNVAALLAGCTVLLDASDNFSTRFLLNRASLRQAIPLVSGAAIRFEAQLSVFNATQSSPCYRCLYDDKVDDAALSCAESGVLSPLVGMVGSMQALEAIKVITGAGQALDGSLLVMDTTTMEFRKLALKKDPACPACGS